MDQGCGTTAAAHGDVVEGVETTADVVQEVVAVGGAGDAARVVAGSVPAAADLEDKGLAGSDSIMPYLVVTACGEEEEVAGMKRKLAKTGFKSPYDSDYDDDNVYEYNSGYDVEDGCKESSIEKEAQKIREKGKTAYFKWGKFMCPYCTTKPKPKDGLSEHLMSHAHGLSTSSGNIKIRAEHAALLKALGLIYSSSMI
ncbi:hypothetical protein D1007_13983 [Hordeum vulgare]|nr:hypothetical protein D1007_13983 [Hordeum vulgare]